MNVCPLHKFGIGGCVATFAALFLLSFEAMAQHSPSDPKSAVASLVYFTGDWDCNGKFDSSGKAIAARQHFAIDLDGTWMLFRHDDKPPFNYHALSEWGWNANRKELVMLAQDSIGGARVFSSKGWEGSTLQWDGDALDNGAAPGQRFTFERLDERHFRVSYYTRKENTWTRVDSSACDKQ